MQFDIKMRHKPCRQNFFGQQALEVEIVQYYTATYVFFTSKGAHIRNNLFFFSRIYTMCSNVYEKIIIHFYLYVYNLYICVLMFFEKIN